MPATVFNLTSTPRNWALYALLLGALTWACFGSLRFHLLETHDFETFRDNAKVSADFAYFFSIEKEQASGRLLHEFCMWLAHIAWGQSPAAFHLLVVALHFAASLLLCRTFFRAGADLELSMLAGLLFLLNVAHFRAIHWLSGFNYVLAFVLSIATVLAYLRYIETGRRPWLAACYASLFLGAFSHLASLMAWPFCFFLAWQQGHDPRRALRQLVPFALVLIPALALVLRFTAKRTSTWEALDFFTVAGLADLVTGVARSTLFFTGRLLSTAHWLPLASHERHTWEFAVGALVLVGLAWLLWKKPGPARIWAGWTLLMLLPFVLLTEESILALPVGPSRYLYLPSAGTALILAWALRRAIFALPVGRPTTFIAITIVLIISSYHGLQQAEALTYYNSGRTYLAAEDDRTGVAQLRLAIARAPELINLEDAYVRLSMGLMRHPDQTATVLKEAFARFPHNAYLQVYNLAYNSLHPDFAEQARLSALKNHAKASSALAQVYSNLGLGYEGLEDLDRAVTAYQYALEFAPDQVKALKRLGAIRYKQGQAGEAVALLQQAQDVAADDRGVAYAAILALQLDGRFAEAIAACQQALAANPSADLYALLGECHEESAQSEPALAAYRQSLTLDPGHTPAHRGLSRLSAQAGHYQTAFASLEKVIALGRANAQDYANLGNLYFRTGARTEAEAAYRQAIELEPSHAASHHDLAVVLRALQRPAEASEALTRAIELEPDNPDYHYKLGSIALALKQLQAAQQSLSIAIELGSHDAYAYLFLGRLYQEQDQVEKALALYEKMLTSPLLKTDERVRAQLKTYLSHMDREEARQLLYAFY
jgi:tetratricopeptide (TPR) repeat protein